MRTLSLPARAAERRHSLPPLRSSSLGGLCRCRDDDGAAYSPLPLDGGAAAAAAAAPRIASRAPTAKASPPGAKKPGPGLVAALEDHPWQPASCPSGWCPGLGEASSSSSLPPVLQQTEVQQLLPGFFDAVLSSFQEQPSPEQNSEEEEPFDVGVATVPHSPSAIARDSPQVASGLVRSRVHEFQEQQRAAAQRRRKQQQEEEEEEAMAMAMAEEEFPRASPAGGKVVIYFTSIRGVRRTFEDGRAVRAILRAYRVRVDECDVSMHAAFKDELRGLLVLHGHGQASASFKDALPRVFVVFGDGADGERWGDMGGADEVRALHEAGELGCALAGCDTLPAVAMCAGCGDMRFLPCSTCSGCCRVFAGDEFLRCPDCNENGLIRCPLCCYSATDHYQQRSTPQLLEKRRASLIV